MAALSHSLAVTWPPFVLVVGLLLIGQVAADEGLFAFAGERLARAPGSGRVVFVLTMAAVAAVSATLNLDTAVVFMTPVALHAARTRQCDERAFLYGSIYMANSASLLFVGSNLTNLLVVADRSTRGAGFTAHTVLPWAVSVVATVAVVLVWRWRALGSRSTRLAPQRVALGLGPGTAAAAFAVVAMLTLAQPALWVLAAGVLAALVDAVRRGRVDGGHALHATSPGLVSLLFLVATGIGWLARSTSLLGQLLAHANVATTASVAALSAIAINNLPAASFYSAHAVAHPFALLVGLDVGPNLAVSGALSSLLWRRIAAREGASTSLGLFSVVGLGVAAVAGVAATALVGRV